MPIDIAKAAKALTAKGANKACASCGGSSFGLHNELTMLSTFDGASTNPGAGIPAVITLCNSCGLIRLHAAHPLGLI